MSNPETPLVCPLVHLNGSGKQSLLDQFVEARLLLSEAIEKLPHPNGRDYYPLGDTALTSAIKQHNAWATTLKGVLNQLDAITENICDQ